MAIGTNSKSDPPLNPPFVFRHPDDYSMVYGVASSLEQLTELLPLIPYYVIEYHLYRVDRTNTIHCDLCNWIRLIIKDERLADAVHELGVSMRDPMKAKKDLVSLLRNTVQTSAQLESEPRQ